jgi:hypothetical protein
MPYGVSRISDDFSDEGTVPLYTGTTELWASEGIIGLFYHLVLLILLPTACLLAYRKKPAGGENSMVALTASYILFLNLWPFAPPFYENYQVSLMVGLCIGYLFYVANEARFTAPTAADTVSPRRNALIPVPKCEAVAATSLGTLGGSAPGFWLRKTRWRFVGTAIDAGRGPALNWRFLSPTGWVILPSPWVLSAGWCGEWASGNVFCSFLPTRANWGEA